MEDKILKCKDCGKEFTFTAAEQERFAKYGWADPIRCPECRKAHRKAKAAARAERLKSDPATVSCAYVASDSEKK